MSDVNTVIESADVAETSAAAKKTPAVTIKSIATSKSDMYRLAPDAIHVKEGFNSRVVDFNPEDPEDLALANSIAVNGVKQPVAVYLEDDQAFLSDGHRRLGAVKYVLDPANGIEVTADLSGVNVLVEARDSSEADRIFAQIVRNQGKPFTGLEQATVYSKLLALGWSEEGIAAKTGFSLQRIRDLLDLSKKATGKVRRMIQSGEISATLAITTIKKTKGDGKKAAALLEQAVGRAKSEGKKKATAKDVHDVKPDNPKVKLRAIFSEIDFAESGDNYIATFDTDQYTTIRSLIGF
jgi:ParB-like chromosome segregation protein Spo0J